LTGVPRPVSETGNLGRAFHEHVVSQRATVDIAGFVLADGGAISVAADWRTAGPRRAFLHDVAQRACGYFSIVLTPPSNAAHRDHVHLDIGPYQACAAR
jgi:hypothetical protein